MKGLVLFLGLIFPSSNSVHPFHSSVMEMSYNQQDQSWEISLRLFQDDLEQTMSAVTGKKFRMVPGDASSEHALDSYIRQHFRFHAGKQFTSPYRWVGSELQQDVVWVYLEIPTKSDLVGAYVENSLFIDEFPDQTNLVSWSYIGQKKSYLFRKSQELQQLSR